MKRFLCFTASICLCLACTLPVFATPGTYYATESDTPASFYTPRLILDDDGKASVRENLYQGMGYYYGSWTKKDHVYTIKVTGINFKGFAGDDVRTIILKETDDGFLLQTDLCASLEGTLFA